MKDETMFSMKRSASAQVRKVFHELQDQIPLYINQAIDAMTFFFIDEDVIKSWMYALNLLQQKGQMALSVEMRAEFLADLTAQASKKFTFELDPASRLLIMGASNIRDTLYWSMKMPEALVSNFYLPGTYGCIDGVPRMGKTSLGVSLMQILHDQYKHKILTNIVIDDAPKWIIQVKKLSSLCLEMDANNQWTCVLDETATYVNRKRALSTANIDFENLTRFVGKMGGRLIMITHSFEMDIPSQLQEWISERYTKNTLDNCYVRLTREGGYIKMHKLITHVPDAELKYVTEDITSLDFDISIKKLLERVQDNVSVEEAVNEQLEKNQPRQTKAERVKEKIELYPEATNEEIAVMAGCSVQTVRDVKNRLKAEHDLMLQYRSGATSRMRNIK